MSLTKRERVIAAVNHDARLDYAPHNIYFTTQMYEKMVEHTGNPNYIDCIGNHIKKVSLRKRNIPIPGRSDFGMDDFGVIWDKSGIDKDIGVVSEYLIKDADELYSYTPPPVDEAYLRAMCEDLMQNKGDCFTFASVGFALFECAWSLCGMENLLCYMITAPEAVESLFSKLEARNLETVNIALDYDFDGVIFGDDWGQQKGLIMGAPYWRKLIKPHVAALYAAVKNAGKYVAQHSCGDNSEIMDELIEMGLNVYQTYQPEIYDTPSFKTKYYSRLTIWGGISTQTQLPFLTPDEMYQVTKDTIAVLGKGGGYIASPTHEVPGDVPPENIEAMVRAFLDQ